MTTRTKLGRPVTIALAVVTLSVSGVVSAQTPQTPAAPAAGAAQGGAAQAASPTNKPQTPAMDESRRVQVEDVDKLIADGKTVLLDVREPKEIAEMGTVDGAITIPLGQLESRLGELPKDRVILTACNGGGRASRALALLEKHGYKTAGFCGLKDYKGKRVHPKLTTTPSQPEVR